MGDVDEPTGTMTIDDSLPYFSYTDKWDQSHGNDQLWFHYSNSTYTSTIITGASMTFQWTGTDIEIWGAKRQTYGWFSVGLDTNPKTYNNSFGTPDIPIQLLFASRDLENGDHQVVFVNEAETYQPYRPQSGEPARVGVDFDFVRITGTPITPGAKSTLQATQSPSPSAASSIPTFATLSISRSLSALGGSSTTPSASITTSTKTASDMTPHTQLSPIQTEAVHMSGARSLIYGPISMISLIPLVSILLHMVSRI